MNINIGISIIILITENKKVKSKYSSHRIEKYVKHKKRNTLMKLHVRDNSGDLTLIQSVNKPNYLGYQVRSIRLDFRPERG